MNNYQVLANFVLNIILRIIGTATSSLLLVVSCRTKLIRKPGLILIHLLIFFDLLYFILGSPQLIYSIVYWDTNTIRFDPTVMLTTGLPIIFHDKNEFTLLIAIAVDRLLAVFFPANYKLLNHRYKALFVAGLSVTVGLGDVYLFLSLSPAIEHSDCAALGCFMSDAYRGILGLSNGILGLILMFFTLVLLLKLRKMSNVYSADNRSREQKNFIQANRTALISLLTAGILVTIPAVLMGFFEKIIGDLMKNIGPVFSILILTSGITNSVTLLARNKEFNQGLKMVLMNRSSSQVMVTPVLQPQSNPTENINSGRSTPI